MSLVQLHVVEGRLTPGGDSSSSRALCDLNEGFSILLKGSRTSYPFVCNWGMNQSPSTSQPSPLQVELPVHPFMIMFAVVCHM